MLKIKKEKLIPVLSVCFLISYILLIFIFNKLAKTEKELTKESETLSSYNIGEKKSDFRTDSDCLFTEYENIDRKICGQRTIKEVKEIESLKADNGLRLESIDDNFNKYPELAGYYLPKNIIDSTSTLDIDKDGKSEELIYYSCPGCNAPSRNVDVIKNGRIIFSAQGGNLEVKTNNENTPGFILSDSGLVLARPEGYTEVKFKLNFDNEYYPYEEKDVRFNTKY